MSEPPPTIRLERHRCGPVEQLDLVTEARVMRRPMRVCVYRIGDALIDAGSAHAGPALVEALRDDPPGRVLLTHQHEDHIGGVSALREAFGDLPVYAPRAHLEIIAAHPPLPAYREAAWGTPARIEGLSAYAPGDVFEVGGIELEAWLTPGHTPDHIAFVSRGRDPVLAFTGDVYLGRRPTDAWFESAADDLVASARRLAGAGDRLVMFPGHGGIHTDGRERLLALADWLEAERLGVLALAEALGTRDYERLARERYGERDPLAVVSAGEFSHRCLVRSILDPVRSLPVGLP